MIKDLTADIKDTVVVSGWVENIRDHGGVLFLDLRDESGTLQTEGPREIRQEKGRDQREEKTGPVLKGRGGGV